MLPRKNMVARRCKLLESKVDKNRAKFKCGKCNHVWWGRMMKKNPIGQEPSEWAIKFFTKYWADGVNMYCPKCSKIK
jgi:Zn finger protein HypA/HybF involved in hydrogenase expression